MEVCVAEYADTGGASRVSVSRAFTTVEYENVFRDTGLRRRVRGHGRRIADVRRASRARIARRARARGARRVMANVLVVDLASPASEDDGAVVVVDAPGTTARRARGRGSADVVLVDERAVTPGRASGRVGKRARASGDDVGALGRCGVCLEAWRLPTATRCGHVFCARCLGTAMRHGSTCPTCRKKVTKASCVRVYL